jgi:hypothetical protein
MRPILNMSNPGEIIIGQAEAAAASCPSENSVQFQHPETKPMSGEPRRPLEARAGAGL